jgi:hypothetical protein
MGRLGFGHGGRGSARMLAPLASAKLATASIPTLAPSAAWTGTAGSGFTSVPSDPVRTTAKPIIRLIDPPNQFFSDALTISVMAVANDGGTLISGIDRVRFRFEGQTVDVLAPALRRFTRYDGSIYWLPCYSVTLKRSVSTVGLANLYIEAIPANATMQSRVLGPYQFGLVATKHDWDKTIGSTGADYTSITAAIAAAKAAAAQNPRVRFITSGTYDMSGGTPNYTPQGYLTLECATGVNVTIAKASYTTDAAMLMRTRWDGLWFKGAGFTLDFAFVSEIYHESQVSNPFAPGRSHVFEGVRFTRSTAPGSLIRKTIPGGSVTYSVRGSPWLLECDVHNMQCPGAAANLYRGVTFRSGFHDVAYGTACVLGCTVATWSSQNYRNLLPAMTVRYTGAGASADLSLSGINGASSRTFTARVGGVSVGTFTALNSEAAFLGGTNYNVSNVVAWLNSLSGWSATLLNDSRLATAITNGSSGYGAFTNIDVKTAALQLFTAFDLHTDFCQKDSVNLVENVLIYGNTGTDIDAQFVMIGGNESRDWAVIDNALDVLVPSDDNAGGTVLTSQFSRAHRHVIFVHNSFAQQSLALRTGTASVQQYDPDTYCLVASNSLRNLSWDGVTDGDLTIKNNHLHAGMPGTGSTGEVKAGNQTTLYVNFDGADFTPAGALATNFKPSVWGWDVTGKKRGSTSRPGAVA